MLKIDIHTHIIPKNIPDYSKKFGYEGFVNLVNINDSEANMILFNENFRTVQCNCWSPTQRLKEYNKFNIDVQVISPIPIMFSYWADPKDTLEVSRFINDFIASVCSENPKKFIGLGTVPMQSPKEAIKELERCKHELKLPGIEIGSNINGANLSDETFHPIFEAAEQLDCSIFIFKRHNIYWWYCSNNINIKGLTMIFNSCSIS